MKQVYQTLPRPKSLVRLAGVVIILFSSMHLISARDIDCSGLPEWSSSAVYVSGDEVVFEGVRYKANYWTQGNNPAQNSDPYEQWANLGACDGGGGTSNQAPSVSLSASASSVEVGATVTLTASASDSDGSIAKVEFYQGANKLGEDSSAPYSFSWSAASTGSFSFTAKAYDNDAAVTTSSSVSVAVTTGDNDGGDNGGGGAGCDGLPSYNAGSSYTQGQEVSNAGGVYECNIPGWCSSNASWAYEPGVGQYWEDAWSFVSECDGGNNGGGDNESPSVSISSPSSGSSFDAGSNITISANASDADGNITKVEFYRNGAYMGEDTSSPYAYTWSGSYAGNYSLTAVAYDNGGASTTSAAVNISVISDGDGGGNGGDIPNKIMVGYWHNFENGSGVVKLRNVSPKWDVINVSFAVPSTPIGNHMVFEPDNAIYTSIQEFKDDVAYLKGQGKKVLISIGGAEGAIHVTNDQEAQAFSSTMIEIINSYGFSGMDIDLEGTSLSLAGGDNDFRNPVSDKIVYFIKGAKTIINNYGDDFVLSMAPETAFVQGGYSQYASIFGAYLPVIYALRDKMDYIHVQHYNSGCMLGLDGKCYSQATADFHVAMADMLLSGFPVANNPVDFPALRPDQVAIGIPSSPQAAGGGYTQPSEVKKALDYIIKGQSFGGSYTMQNGGGYPNFRGLMTWSINWDLFNGNEYVNNYRPYLDGVMNARIAAEETPVVDAAFKSYPNPFTGSTKVSFVMEAKGAATLTVYSVLGEKVVDLKNEVLSAGNHIVEWNAAGVPSGMYFIRLSVAGKTQTFKVYKK